MEVSIRLLSILCIIILSIIMYEKIVLRWKTGVVSYMVKYLKRQEELVEEALSKDNCSDWEV